MLWIYSYTEKKSLQETSHMNIIRLSNDLFHTNERYFLLKILQKVKWLNGTERIVSKRKIFLNELHSICCAIIWEK